jgi:hypothetical protein
MSSAKPHNQNMQHPFFPCNGQSNSGQKADVPEAEEVEQGDWEEVEVQEVAKEPVFEEVVRVVDLPNPEQDSREGDGIAEAI